MCLFSISGTDCSQPAVLTFNQTVTSAITPPAQSSNPPTFALTILVSPTVTTYIANLPSIPTLLVSIASFAGSMIGIHALLRSVLEIVHRQTLLKMLLFGIPMFFLPGFLRSAAFDAVHRYGLLVGSSLFLVCGIMIMGYLFAGAVSSHIATVVAENLRFPPQQGVVYIGQLTTDFTVVQLSMLMVSVAMLLAATVYYRTVSNQQVHKPGAVGHFFVGLLVGFIPIIGLPVILVAGSVTDIVTVTMELGCLFGVVIQLAVIVGLIQLYGIFSGLLAETVAQGIVRDSVTQSIEIASIVNTTYSVIATVMLMLPFIMAYFRFNQQRFRRPGHWYDWIIGFVVSLLLPFIAPFIFLFMDRQPLQRLLASFTLNSVVVAMMCHARAAIDPLAV